jgi:hypothetical protein
MKNLFLPIIICLLLIVPTIAQKDLQTIRNDKQNDGYVGVALVIGNSNYQYATVLNSPVNDALDIGKTLELLGFKVLKVRTNANITEMETAIAEFGRELAKNQGVGVFYYSGHGVQAKGLNYLIPVEANIPTESFLKQKAIDLESVMGTMDESTDKAKIIILDACRNDPFKNWRVKGDAVKGLAKIDAPEGMLVAFATSPSKTAADGIGRNSPYTEVLLQEIVKPNVSITDMLQDVRTILKSKYNQTSWENTSLLGKFYFAGSTNPNSKLPIIQRVEIMPRIEAKPSIRGEKSGKILFVSGATSDISKIVFKSDSEFRRVIITKLKQKSLTVVDYYKGDLKGNEEKQYSGGLLNRTDEKAMKLLPVALVFKVDVDVLEDLPQYQGLYVSKVSGYCELIDTENNKTVGVERFTDVRGFGNSQEQSRKNALKSAAEGISDSFLNQVKEKAR